MDVRNPFSVPGLPLTWFFSTHGTSLADEPMATVANTYTLNGFSTPSPVQFNTINIDISTNDAVNIYSFGLYDATGKLVCTSAPATFPAAGIVAISVTGGPITIPAGRYYFASTGNATVAKYLRTGGDGTSWSFFYGNSLG